MQFGITIATLVAAAGRRARAGRRPCAAPVEQLGRSRPLSVNATATSSGRRCARGDDHVAERRHGDRRALSRGPSRVVALAERVQRGARRDGVARHEQLRTGALHRAARARCPSGRATPATIASKRRVLHLSRVDVPRHAWPADVPPNTVLGSSAQPSP